MSYLRIALQRQAERHRLNQSDIARGCGLSRSYISRLFTGDARELSDENFIALLNAFPGDMSAQAELIAARCRDACVGPAAKLVDITVKSTCPPERGEPEFPSVQLSPDAERAFAWLRSQCPLRPGLEQHLLGFARLTGMK